MTRNFSKTLPAMGLLISMVFGAQASADTYDHIYQLAHRIEQKANGLVRASSQYRHTPGYGTLLRNSKDLARHAGHITDVVYHDNCLYDLQADLAQIDAKFHWLNDFFYRVECEARNGVGRIHGPTGHVQALLKCIKNDIRQLRDDVESLLATARWDHGRPNRAVVNRRSYYPKNSGYSSQRFNNPYFGSYRGYSDFGRHANQSFGRSRGYGISFGNGAINFRF